MEVPLRLRETCARNAAAGAWLAKLPGAVADLERRWSLRLGQPFDGGTYAWVAPVERADGSSAVLKVALPHFEADHEGDGLRFWNGDGAVRLLESDRALSALLVERCAPGTPLSARSRVEQDAVLAGLLLRLWRVPPAQPFRPLAYMAERWCNGAVARRSSWADVGLMNEGLRLFEELPQNASAAVLLATDLHAGNVLASEREPWLVIDPKPFVGDPAYDATQHLLFDSRANLLADPEEAIRSFADLLEVSQERVHLWTFARAALMSGTDPERRWASELARALAR
jgi:streptomycin 6-kinase